MDGRLAFLSHGLLALGSKYDPTFRVSVEEWRKSIGGGYTDPKGLPDQEFTSGATEFGANRADADPPLRRGKAAEGL